MNILSLFDGMSCGYLAMLKAEVLIDRYVAYEIDKYAIKTSSHNFPGIEHKGDVFTADFTEYEGFDFVIGGSPCTYWSIAQKNNRETEASGMGWELFQQYVRAIKEAKPKYFIYENNKSMSKAIRKSIDETFGFEAVCINSALVSAQNRNRLYWVGKRTADGTYRKVNVEQPEDRGVLLQDILMSGVAEQDKSYCLKHQAGNARDYIKKHHTSVSFEPVGTTKDGKSFAVTAYYSTGQNAPHTLNKHIGSMVAQPVALCTTKDGKKARCLVSSYYKAGENPFVEYGSERHKTRVAEPVRVGTMPDSKGQISNSREYRIYSVEGKGITQAGNAGGLGAKTGLYAVPIHYFAFATEFDDNGNPTKAISFSDGKKHKVYIVKNGLITFKDKQYPIKLADGYYIIRKLTVQECMKLQTVPEWYEFPVSDTQAYKMLGNGFTIDVITWLIQSALTGNVELEQIKLF